MKPHLRNCCTHGVTIALLLLAFAVSPALAWSLSGHKVIASIAFRQLSADEQTKTIEWLKRHPRFVPDFSDAMPDDVRNGGDTLQHEWLFQQASVWPDLIRSGPADKTAFSRPEWHYINGPVFLDAEARTALDGKLPINSEKSPPADATLSTTRMNISQALSFARQQLASNDTPPADRAVLLAWLFHLVGDIHQPLHSSALVSQRLFPEGDRGGNSIRLTQRRDLHSLWDNFPGEAMEYRVARNRAIAYGEIPHWQALGQSAAKQLDHNVWLAESETDARQYAYDHELLTAVARLEAAGAVQPITLSERYLKAGGEAAETRFVTAGYRLGAVLKKLLAQ